MLKTIFLPFIILFSILSGLLLSTLSFAATKHHRLIWDSDPSSNATIGFSPDGSSQSPYVLFGTATDEGNWERAPVNATATFRGSLISHFVRLKGLTPDSAVYYQVCDNAGCGERYWFKTAPIDNQPFVAIAGGDTRTGWTNRQKGNQLVSKIRPLFIMHGGDFTNANNSSEMNAFLADWALTFSDDSIDGVPYKRIYPMIPTHGNHEDNNYETLCEVFGVDFNADDQCNALDTYGAFNISPLLRVYTLNSQFKNSGWSSYANTMNNWLSGDLASQGATAAWRFAQYHKPIFPHYTGKSENQILFNWWATYFYDYAMNLVVESDTHITKLTKSIKPSGSNFVETTAGGTVYVGEGSWGAPARSANDPKSWTIDLASIQQFKVITVTPDALDVRTAQFDEGAGILTREERALDSSVLPNDINWWSANAVGDTLKLVRNADNRSLIEVDSTPNPDTGEQNAVFPAVADSFISQTKANENFSADSRGLLADGADSEFGVLDTLIKWDLSDLPACSVITSASIKLRVFNTSDGPYRVYSGAQNWDETTVTWNTVSGSAQQGNTIASFTAASSGLNDIVLSFAGLSEVQKWLNGYNFGVVVTSDGSNNGIDFDSKETGQAAQLSLRYIVDESCSTDPDLDAENVLRNRVSKTNLYASASQTLSYYLDVEEGASQLRFTITGGTGDADLYAKFADKPTMTDYDCRPHLTGNSESCVFDAAPAGRYHVTLNAYASFSGMTLTASYADDLSAASSMAQEAIAGGQGTWRHFPVTIPEGTGQLSVVLSGRSGDGDLYLQQGKRSTITSYVCRPWLNGNDESCTADNPGAGLWFISIYAYETYSGANVNASWRR